jgi:hypothetical protein
MIDPQLVAEVFKKTTTNPLPFPPPTTTSVAPIPSIIPDTPRFEKIGEAGTKALWVRQTPYVVHRHTLCTPLTLLGGLCDHARVYSCRRTYDMADSNRKFVRCSIPPPCMESPFQDQIYPN